MKKIFLSLPMKGVPFKEILYNIECMKAELLQEIEADPERFGVKSLAEIEFVDNARGTSHPADDYKYPPLWYLGQAIQRLGDCDFIAFQEDWEFANGCRAEFEISRIYQISQILPKYSGGYVIVEPGPFAGPDYYKKKGEAKQPVTVTCDVPDSVKVGLQNKHKESLRKACQEAEYSFKPRVESDTGRVEVDPQSHFNKSLSFARKEAEWFFVNLLGSKMVEKEDVKNCNDMVDAIIDAAVLKMEWKKSILEENK